MARNGERHATSRPAALGVLGDGLGPVFSSRAAPGTARTTTDGAAEETPRNALREVPCEVQRLPDGRLSLLQRREGLVQAHPSVTRLAAMQRLVAEVLSHSNRALGLVQGDLQGREAAPASATPTHAA